MLPGVTKAKKKDGTPYYRSSLSVKSKHVSLGSFDTEDKAHQAYVEAISILREGKYTIDDYKNTFALDFSKFVILINYRNTGLYFKTPIYLQKGFFYYYINKEHYLIFDREDLFYYANHKIQIRGGYYFICDYGSQYNILGRYGIKNYAKKGIDYIFVNQNDRDFRYENIQVINEYMGVTKKATETGIDQNVYECVIHIRGNYLVGRYTDKIAAAIAYNKAVDTLADLGIHKKYIKNYINELTSEEYHKLYEQIKISPKITHYDDTLQRGNQYATIEIDSDK